MHILNDIFLTLIPVHLLREPQLGPSEIGSTHVSSLQMEITWIL